MDKEKEQVFVIGHKNPDTDSICSSIAYAYLKNKTGEHEYIPRRAGKINEETQYVLKRFKVKEPSYISEVGTQIKDIEIRRVEGVADDISLKTAWSLMKKIDIATLPIVSQSRLKGLITIDDIARSYMEVYDNRILSEAGTRYKSIAETLEGEVIVGDEEASFCKGKVLIAAAKPEVMETFIDEGDMVVAGDRYESQFCAIESGAACIILCVGAEISATIRKLATERGCVVITTELDSYTVARLINQSIPIRHFMSTENLMIFREEDYIEQIKYTMAKYRFRYFPILDVDDRYVGMISKRNMLNAARKKLILVDHNEKSQAVEGVEEAEILEIIDHHRIGSIETINPVYFRNQPLGCTATIIYDMFCENDVEIPKEIAGLLCSAILSDTLYYTSPTCTAKDRKAGESLAKIAEIDTDEFAGEMFKAGSSFKGKTAGEIFYQDCKVFNINDISLEIGQVNIISNDEIPEIREKIVEYLKENHSDGSSKMTFFMLTSIMDRSTTLIYYGSRSRETAQQAFDMSCGENSVYLKGIVSRKKQVVPALMVAIQN
ncbi:putative manganese-dependent inorganic diphosphatase [Parasporobacterium paucivorans]|uniref:inorganic diphosphatase n=1 Tax=Parasporobacterium paucivorans DSM 15970 TaxID=1122934 RepID=A0A1M6BDJ2_9FIRM|nr:putative manganese-dependent inorganic diphosphatase [Parasporobacterium paucivorans]SHI46785.1 manganese-dependent inorganic pyrophosphatase [Parasporobacterium paucivorans DSM 15970]